VRKQLVLTASGRDRVGIIEEMTELLLRYEGNVESSRMVRLGGDPGPSERPLGGALRKV